MGTSRYRDDDDDDDDDYQRPRRSSRRRNEDDDDDEEEEEEEDYRPTRRSSRGRGFRCPYCDSSRPPVVTREISQTGWIVFIVLLCFIFIGWLFCWVGLLMKEEKRMCRECGMKLG